MSAAEMLEQRIRECAYYLWESSGRPFGRDEEFWQQACETIATSEAKPKSRAKPRQARKPAQTPRRRSYRESSQPASISP